MLAGDVASLGVTTLEDRLKAIAYAVQLGLRDPAATEWVMRVVANCPDSNTAGAAEQEIRCVFEALKAAVKYRYHPRGTDRIQTLMATLRLRAADCDQATAALCTALHILGFQTAAVVMSSDGDHISHIWAQVGLPRNNPTRWVDLELTTGPDGTPRSAVAGYSVPMALRAWWKRYVFHFS